MIILYIILLIITKNSYISMQSYLIGTLYIVILLIRAR